MLSRVFLICFLWFSLNGLLAKRTVKLEDATYLDDDEEMFLIYSPGSQNAGNLACSDVYTDGGDEDRTAYLIRSQDALDAAKESDDLKKGRIYRIDLTLDDDTWTWGNGDTIDEDDEFWHKGHPKKNRECAAFYRNNDDGGLLSQDCYGNVNYVICEVSDSAC